MTEDKKYPIDLIHGCVDCPNIEQRIGENLNHLAFKMALDFGFDGLYESDIQWIEKHITKNSQNNIRDIFWKQDSYTHETHNNRYFLDYQTTFFEQFQGMGKGRQLNSCIVLHTIPKIFHTFAKSSNLRYDNGEAVIL